MSASLEARVPDRDEAQRRSAGARKTALIVAALALAIYAGFIAMMAVK